MTTTTVAAPPKLPLWRTIGQAYALWSKNFPELMRICWPWMLVMAPIMVQLLASLDPLPHIAAVLGAEQPQLRRASGDCSLRRNDGMR